MANTQPIPPPLTKIYIRNYQRLVTEVTVCRKVLETELKELVTVRTKSSFKDGPSSLGECDHGKSMEKPWKIYGTSRPLFDFQPDIQNGAPKIAKLRYKWLNYCTVYGRHNYRKQ